MCSNSCLFEICHKRNLRVLIHRLEDRSDVRLAQLKYIQLFASHRRRPTNLNSPPILCQSSIVDCWYSEELLVRLEFLVAENKSNQMCNTHEINIYKQLTNSTYRRCITSIS